MARPLEKTTNGKLYARPPEIEAAADAVLAQDLATQRRRALIRNRHDPEYLPSECLVHLIREARRRGDDAARDKLLPLLLARCEANLNAKVDGQISGLSQARQWGEVVLRMLVTGKLPARGGGGMPQRIVISSRPVSVLRMTGAG